MEGLNDDLDKETVKDGHLSVLQSTLEEAKEESRVNEESYSEILRTMEDIMRNIQDIEQEMATHDPSISALREELEVAQSESYKVADKRRKIQSDKNAASEQVEGMKRERQGIDQRRTEITAKIRDFNEKASMVSERVEVSQGETPASLDKKLDRLRRDLQRYDQQ